MRVVVEERNRGEKQGKMEEKRQRDSYTVTMGKKPSKRNEGRLHAIHCKTPNHKSKLQGYKAWKRK